MNVLPFQQQGPIPVQKQNRNEKPKTRSIVLPSYVWDALDEDAVRCRRSSIKQLEALLIRYYNLESDVELDEEAMNEASHAVSQKPRLKKTA